MGFLKLTKEFDTNGVNHEIMTNKNIILKVEIQWKTGHFSLLGTTTTKQVEQPPNHLESSQWYRIHDRKQDSEKFTTTWRNNMCPKIEE